MSLETIRVRLEAQLEALDVVLAGATAALIEARPSSGDWSARENLAHLARHGTVFLDRLDRILREDTPTLGRYRAEEDLEWPRWSDLPLDEVLGRLKDMHRRLLTWLRPLSHGELNRRGLHPAFGALTIPEWLEFFLLHEAHHLYTAMICIAEARRAQAAGRRLAG
jgi:DinB superfamily